MLVVKSGEESARAFRLLADHPAISALIENRRLLSLVDQALISISNMCTTIIIARNCPKQELGLYASGFSLVLLTTAVQTALVSVPYTISSPHLPAPLKRLYKGSTVLQQIGLALLGMLLFFVAGSSSTYFPGRSDLVSVLLTLSVVSGVLCFRDFARRASYAQLDFSFAVIIDGIAAVFQVLGILALALTRHLTASHALQASGLAAAIASVAWVAMNWQSIEFSSRHALQDFKTNWRLGRWLFSSSVLWSFSVEQYPWILTSLSSPSAAANWASCYGVMAFLNPVVLALNNDAAPRISNDFASGGLAPLRRSVQRAALIGSLITLPIILVLLIFGSRFVSLMYGGRYAGSGVVVSALTIGFAFYAASLPFPYGMLALKRPELDFSINVICFFTFVTLGIWLVRTHGVVGAAISFFLIQSVAFGCRVVFFRISANAEARSQAQRELIATEAIHA